LFSARSDAFRSRSPMVVARTTTALRRENGAAEDAAAEEREAIEVLGALEPVLVVEQAGQEAPALAPSERLLEAAE
jgi:hypothetical protein